ncbi:MAG: hypothetical protein E6108_17220, partial [Clostridium perfringens]|nr:hypothetical protein [Clostridium perfringens]
KRKEQKEKIYFEEGNVENTSFFYRLDLLIERSEIRKKIPFLSTEIYLLFLGIISVITFIIGNLIFGLIGGVLGITLSILIIHSILFLLARNNYEKVDSEITKFVNLVESYSISSNDILTVMGSVYPYLNDPLRAYIETFYNEVSTTGDYDKAFMNLKNKAESARLKRVIENLELASQNEANYNEIIDDERKSLKAYSNAKEKRKELIVAGRSDIIACLIMGFVTIYMLSGLTTGVGSALVNSIVGNIIIIYWIITIGYIIWRFISFDKGDRV